MKQYIGTKIIKATHGVRLKAPDGSTAIHTDMDGCALKTIENLVAEHGYTMQEGYKVAYPPDLYESWSPKDVFEKAYRLTDGMNFGLAVEAMKMGRKVSRRGWNGKGMFLFLAEVPEFHTDADLLCVSHLHGDLTLPSIVMKTADDHFCVGWLASQTDMLADDWEIVE